MKEVQAKSAARPSLFARFILRTSNGRQVDGLWIGAFESKGEAEPLIRCVEEALALIKQYDRIRYDRLTRDLERILVTVLAGDAANFESSIVACQIDKRFVSAATTTPDVLASVIVHEAAHARLWRRGIRYDAALRARIEQACARRELAFARKLPNGRHFEDHAKESVTRYADPQLWTREAFIKRYNAGAGEAVRYLGLPEWAVTTFTALGRLAARLRRLRALLRIQA